MEKTFCLYDNLISSVKLICFFSTELLPGFTDLLNILKSVKTTGGVTLFSFISEGLTAFIPFTPPKNNHPDGLL